MFDQQEICFIFQLRIISIKNHRFPFGKFGKTCPDLDNRLENTQRMVAQALGKAENLINVQVRRVGGAYGGKTRITGHVAAATAVAATKLNRPVR